MRTVAVATCPHRGELFYRPPDCAPGWVELTSHESYNGVIAMSLDLGSVTAMSDPVIWVFGYVRNPSIDYVTANGTSAIRPYYALQYSNVQDLVRSI